MASQSLYRKWRSQTFSDFVGQEHVIRTLKNALANDNPAHAYLFTGPRGTGKTSTARLLAKTINCAHPVDGEPCNQCEQCREITAGNSFNVIEIDAASNRGIDSIRDLRERVMIPPSTGKYKVYVLDEAHMLTTEAFNALLKTLEEPPDYAIFVMATTDVHKMLPTVLSRCQRFDFKRFTTRQIVGHLSYIAEQEHVTVEKSALELIARAAGGGMRDALSLLDQAIAYAGSEISLAQVQSMLGVADPRAIFKLISTVPQLDSPSGLHLIHELSEAGADLRQINNQVGEYWRALMLCKAGADIATILDLTEDEIRDISELTRLFGLEELTEFARIFAQNDLMQKNQGTPQLGLELAFLQCVELHRRSQSGQALGTSAAPASSPRQISPQSTVSQAVPEQIAPPSFPQLQPQTSRTNGASAQKPVETEQVAQVEVPVAKKPVEGSEASSARQTEATSLTLEQVQEAWDRVKKRVKTKDKKGPTISAYLNDFSVVGVAGTIEETIVSIQAAHEFHYTYVRAENRSQYVDWALFMEFRQICRARLLPPDSPIPGIIPPAMGSPIANTTMPTTPQQAPYRESSAPVEPPSVPARPKKVGQAEQFQHSQQLPRTQSHKQVEPENRVPSTASSEQEEVPLARKGIVRENTDIGTPQSLFTGETLEQKARRDPVVQAVVKTFAANIVDVRPK